MEDEEGKCLLPILPQPINYIVAKIAAWNCGVQIRNFDFRLIMYDKLWTMSFILWILPCNAFPWIRHVFLAPLFWRVNGRRRETLAYANFLPAPPNTSTFAVKSNARTEAKIDKVIWPPGTGISGFFPGSANFSPWIFWDHFYKFVFVKDLFFFFCF